MVTTISTTQRSRVTSKKTHKLSPDHLNLLREWFIAGLSNAGVKSRMELYNEQATANNTPLFPSLHSDTISYWRSKMAREVNRVINGAIAAEQLTIRRGLRDRDERIKRLEWAAEQLEPYLAQASIKGQFSASEQYCVILDQIRGEMEPRITKGEIQAQQTLDPTVIRTMPIETVKALADEFLGRTKKDKGVQ